jgi:lipoprotein-anchoring transpeptidase ErfK/SrfK
MSVVRKLSVIYLLCAALFSVQWAFDRDPALERASRRTVAIALETVRARVVVPGIALARAGGEHLFTAARAGGERLFAALSDHPSKSLARRTAPRTAPRHIAAASRRAPVRLVAPKPLLAVPSANIPDLRVAEDVAPSKPSPAALARASLSPAELVRVSMRLKENLTREMLENFSLFLYVSKADTGPWAQRLYVFRKDGGGLTMLYNWPASTGRELDEIAANGTRQQSTTPQGYYQLDPHRMYRTHFSGQWREPMPNAMFFKWEHNGYQTGLAIHGATPLEIRQLGSRASAGCIRIAPENAALLFNLIRAQYKGLTPRFAFNRRTATMSNRGVLMHDAAGNLQMAEGYKVLVFVENYGGENVVAALF